LTARIFNVLAGAWLIATGVAWPHGGLATMTIACGALTVLVGMASIFNGRLLAGNWLRAVGVAAAGLLVIATLALSNRHQPTFWNNIIAAVAVIVSTLLMGSGGRASVREEREYYGHL
jgi:chromate transport protein ChrA